MWKDDRFWMPYFLAGQLFKAYFLFKDDEETILEQSIQLVDSLND
jgi:lipid-A-disaccharide synthase-like uncharacterized protein